MQIILDRHFNNLEQFIDEVQHWDLDFRLLGVGGFVGRMKQLVSRDVIIGYARFDRGLDQVGSTPLGYRTFAIVGNRCHGFRWRKHQITQNDLLIFPENNELQGASHADFEVFTISVHRDYLNQLVDNLGLNWILNKREVVHLDALTAQGLRHLAGTIVKPSAGGSEIQTAVREFTERLVICATDSLTEKIPSLRKRDLAVDSIVEFVRSVPEPTSELAQLCRIAGVSERTLQYAFKERYGIAPNVFVKRWNLNSARQLLLSANSTEISISDIALRFGFSHHSQFATDYKKLFAELPSKTLGR